MSHNIIVGDTHEFELTQQCFSNFYFDVLSNGISTGEQVKVDIYGQFSIPLGLTLSETIQNKLVSTAINQFKKGYIF